MNWLMGSRIGKFLMIGWAVVVAGVAAWFSGRNAGKLDAARKQMQGYINTRKRIDETNLGDDPDVLRDWLRDRDPNKR
jgi:hypothetical protein